MSATDSMYMTTAKGLINLAGQNNCFLNVVIQALWHLRSFRTKFFSVEDHTHSSADDCAHCALKSIFTQYRFSEETNIPPFALRDALASLYKSEAKFQRGDLDDAAEALEAVLTCLQRGETTAPQNSLSHRVFGIDLAEVVKCSCGASAAPQVSSHFIYYTYVSSICELHRSNPSASFEQLVRTVGHQDYKSCPNEASCTKKIRVVKELHNHPEVFAMGLVWSTPDPTQDEIVRMLRTISTTIDLSHIFAPHQSRSKHVLRGMICYYGKHYDAYFYSKSRNTWMVFDDITVKSVGMQWEDVVDRCRRGRFHPSVLFFENDAPKPIAATEAPIVAAQLTPAPTSPAVVAQPVPTPTPTPVPQVVPQPMPVVPQPMPVVSQPMPGAVPMALQPVQMVPMAQPGVAGRVFIPVYGYYYVPVVPSYPVHQVPNGHKYPPHK